MRTPIYTGLFQSDLDANGYKISGLHTPTASADAATKGYVDAHSGGGGGGGSGLPEGWVSVMDHDAVSDAKLVKDAAMTNASAVLTSATAVFTADDVGKSVSVNGVGAAGAILQTTISGFTNATTVTLGATAGTTASAQYCVFGTDNTAFVQDAIAAATSTVFFPPGQYLFAGSIGVVPAGISLVGANHFGPSWYVYTSYPGSPVEPLASGGSILLLTANAGNATGTKFITTSANTAITGLTFYWPNQIPISPISIPVAYPWAIYLGQGNACSVKYCQLVNAYQGIYLENSFDSLVEEIRGECLHRGVKMEGCPNVSRLRGCCFDDQWSNANGGNGLFIDAYRKTIAIAFDIGRNDLLIIDNCFAYSYGNWVHFYDDATHGGTPWVQVRGGGGDQCSTCVKVEQTSFMGVDIDGVHLSGGPLDITSTNNGSLRIHNSLFHSQSSIFGTVAGVGEVTIEDCFFASDFAGGTTPVASANTGIAVTGTGNFALRGCTFKTTQTHLSLGASLVRAVVTGNMCSDTFVVTNSMTAGSAVIDGNTGQGTVYVGADARLVAISGGVKLEVRNTGTGTWVEATRYTNP